MDEIESMRASKRWLEKERKRKGELGDRQSKRLEEFNRKLKEYPKEAEKEIRNLKRDVKKERIKRIRYRRISVDGRKILDGLLGV